MRTYNNIVFDLLDVDSVLFSADPDKYPDYNPVSAYQTHIAGMKMSAAYDKPIFMFRNKYDNWELDFEPVNIIPYTNVYRIEVKDGVAHGERLIMKKENVS